MLYFFTFFNESWLLYSVYSKIFESQAFAILTISLLFSTSQFSKIIFDIIFGFFLQKINRKAIFSIACFLRLAAIAMWVFIPSKTTFFIGMALVGIHMSAFMQHFEGYLFDARNKSEKYQSVLGKYYSVMNFSIFLTSGFIAIFNSSLEKILIIQLIITSIAAVLSIFLPARKYEKKEKNGKIFKIIKSILTKEKSSIMMIIVVSEALFMNFANMISVMLASHSGAVAAKLLMAISIIKIPLNYIAGKMKISNPLRLNLATLCLSLPLFLFFETTDIVAIFVYFVLYTVGIIHIYNIFHSKIDESERMTITSIATILMSVFAIFFDLSIGFFNIKYGICINIAISILIIYAFTKLFQQNSKTTAIAM